MEEFMEHQQEPDLPSGLLYPYLPLTLYYVQTLSPPAPQKSELAERKGML